MIDYADRFAFGARYDTQVFDGNLATDTYKILDIAHHFGGNLIPALLRLLHQGWTRFHIDHHIVQTALAKYFNLIKGGERFRLHQYRFDLRGEYIHSADNQHIVAAACDSLHPDMCTAAFARGRIKYRNVAGTIADYWKGFLGKRGEHDLPLLSVGQGFTAVDINTLNQKVVLPDVQTSLGFYTFVTYSWPQDFGQSIDIHAIYTHSRLKLVAHLLGPWFRPVDTQLQRQFTNVQPHLVSSFGQIQGV